MLLPPGPAAPPTKTGDYTVTGTLDQPGRDQLRATATLRVTDPVVSLAPTPTSARRSAAEADQPYTAEGTTAAGRKADVATSRLHHRRARQVLPGHRQGRCTASKVGDYTVTATLAQKRPRDDLTATASF